MQPVNPVAIKNLKNQPKLYDSNGGNMFSLSIVNPDTLVVYKKYEIAGTTRL
jgi:hypothetical protein